MRQLEGWTCASPHPLAVFSHPLTPLVLRGAAHRHDLAVPTLVESLRGRGIQGVRCFHEHTMALTVPLEGCSTGIFDEHSQARLLQKVKELEVKLSRESLIAKQAQERLETSKSAFIECEQVGFCGHSVGCFRIAPKD